MLSRLYRFLTRVTEKVHDPKRPRALVLSRRTFTSALALVAFGGVARPASPRVSREVNTRKLPRPPRGVVQETLLRGEVELAIGAILEGDPAYLFEDVRALARDAEGLIYVADSGSRTVRVFDHRGTHLYSFGGRGGGPWRIPDIAPLRPGVRSGRSALGEPAVLLRDLPGRCLGRGTCRVLRCPRRHHNGALRKPDVRRAHGNHGPAPGAEHSRREGRARSGDGERRGTQPGAERARGSGFRRMGMARRGATVTGGTAERLPSAVRGQGHRGPRAGRRLRSGLHSGLRHSRPRTGWHAKSQGAKGSSRAPLSPRRRRGRSTTNWRRCATGSSL